VEAAKNLLRVAFSARDARCTEYSSASQPKLLPLATVLRGFQQVVARGYSKIAWKASFS
jgi:hypothetical protein